MHEPRPPALQLLLGEALAFGELPRLVLRSPELARLPRGDGAPVLVLPGFGAGDASTLLLRGYLRYLGYAVHGWGMGLNQGDVRALVPHVIERTRRLVERSGVPVRLVGWSLGGTLARETAREQPELVRQVVTMGTPVIGGPKYTAMANVFRRGGVDLDAIEREIAERERVPIRVPITALYSRADGVVAWQACIDRVSPAVENVEVAATHVGLGFAAEVYRHVALRLAAPSAPDPIATASSPDPK